MAATSKTVNYTDEQTAEMVEAYKNHTATVEDLATKMGRSVRSVIAKLSREGVYKAKERVSKTGEAVIKKDEVANQIGMLVDATESEIESLTKANKTVLAKILKRIVSDTLAAESEE